MQNIMVDQDNPSVTSQLFDISTMGEGFVWFQNADTRNLFVWLYFNSD